MPYLARSGEDLFVTIPLDEDGNHIADGWEHNQGAATDDAETNPPGDGTAGDGFTRYEEYRGFMAWGNHWRTDPDGAKIVFLCDLSGLGSGDFPATALNVRMIYDTEYDQNRVVNFNRQTPPQSHNQCGVSNTAGVKHSSDGELPTAKGKVTGMLTVWRRLHVEVDSMGPEPDDHTWDAENDDLLRGDIDDVPFPGYLTVAFQPAYILPVRDTGNDEGTTAWIQYLYEGWTDRDIVLRDGRLIPAESYYNEGVYGGWYRQTPEAPDYWSVYVCAAYEESADWDNDPDGECWNLGRTYDAGPYYSYVWMEEMRDWGVYQGWSEGDYQHSLAVLVVHEIGHHFRLGHSGYLETVMDTITPHTPIFFGAEELAQIRACTMP